MTSSSRSCKACDYAQSHGTRSPWRTGTTSTAAHNRELGRIGEVRHPQQVRLAGGVVAVEQVADLIDRWNRDVFADLAPSLEPALSDSGRAVTRLKDQLPIERLIIRATRGVEYRIESWIHTVVLVPSQLNRPWVDLAEYRGIKFIVYPAAAAGEGSDSQLADIYKALGDETRLRILRLMASGATSLTDMAERLGLAKSTVHGHLVVLRGAGITRSVVGAGGKTYVLNDRPDLNALFDSFLKG